MDDAKGEVKMKDKSPVAPRINVIVTQELIDLAIRKSSSHCMISDAIKVAVPDATFVSTDISTVRLTRKSKGYRYVYLTPRGAQLALVYFDQGDPVAPFTFQLRHGHVTLAGRHQDAFATIATEEGKPRNKAKLIGGRTPKSKTTEGTPPRRVGGKTPPRFVPHTRREFGIRALGAKQIPDEAENNGE